MYRVLPTMEAFNQWHETVKLLYGIPFAGTVAYTTPNTSNVNSGVAFAVTADLPESAKTGSELNSSLYFWMYGVEESINELF